MSACNAKTKSSGEPCKKHAMKGKTRCRVHGGATKNGGAPKGNKNRKNAGAVYSKYYTDEEKIIIEDLSESKKIDDELGLMRIRLIRLLKAEAEQEALKFDDIEDVEGIGDARGTDYELESVSESPAILMGGVVDNSQKPIQKKVFKKIDYTAQIDRVVARIQSLTVIKSQLEMNDLVIEEKAIMLEKLRQSIENNEEEAQPVQVLVSVQDGRVKHESKTNSTTSEISSTTK